jgi:hypothetical protein
MVMVRLSASVNKLHSEAGPHQAVEGLIEWSGSFVDIETAAEAYCCYVKIKHKDGLSRELPIYGVSQRQAVQLAFEFLLNLLADD